jgi:hypothetical protein
VGRQILKTHGGKICIIHGTILGEKFCGKGKGERRREKEERVKMRELDFRSMALTFS